MLLLDVKNRKWSKEMCKICGISEDMLPKLYESYEVVGTLKKEVAEELGLSESVKIIAGADDNAAAAVGARVVGEGGCNISLGTSGTLFVSSTEHKEDKVVGLHSFCHEDGGIFGKIFARFALTVFPAAYYNNCDRISSFLRGCLWKKYLRSRE